MAKQVSKAPRRASAGSRPVPEPADTPIEPPDMGANPMTAMHELFNRHIREVLDNPDLDEEQKQEIVVAMACPCCKRWDRSCSVSALRARAMS